MSPGKNGFEPVSLAENTPLFSLPGESWLSILQTPCAFAPQFFLQVMHNLIRNPNLSSSYLFRAEIFYDSLNDVSVSPSAYHSSEEAFGNFERHMKRELRPRRCQEIAGFAWQRTWVRRLVPRNPSLDKDLVQTCHAFVADRHSRGDNDPKEENLIIYLPHVDDPEQMPWYHPSVSALAFQYSWLDDESGASGMSALDKDKSEDSAVIPKGTITLHYRLFPETALDTRLQRIALNLLTLVHRHGTGQAAGYTKRVLHDRVVPQAAFQNTYTLLKARYAKQLIGDWIEQTDPTKHVFEDLGIAAFLIELWRQMYRGSDEVEDTKETFPGFVDIGCGNGVLVFILQSEGYDGWGFDARKRKTWEMFPPAIRNKLKEMILVPDILGIENDSTSLAATAICVDAAVDSTTLLPQDGTTTQPLTTASPNTEPPLTSTPANTILFHPGIFPEGTFIISNHADELTPWTPLLASLCNSPFIAIPCCSHNLAGGRFRAPTAPLQNGKPPSAYASLCAWVERLADEVGFVAEREMLRIPSTRNVAIVGRKRKTVEDGRRSGEDGDVESGSGLEDRRQAVVREVLEREMGVGIESIAREWVERTGKIGGKGCGH